MTATSPTAAPEPLMPDSPLYAAYFQGLAQEQIVVRQCTDCQTVQWPPRELCRTCQGSQLQDHSTATTGQVYTYSVMHRAFHPWFADRLPYGAVVVEVEPGVRLLGRYVGDDDPSTLICGEQMEAVFGTDGVQNSIGWRRP